MTSWLRYAFPRGMKALEPSMVRTEGGATVLELSRAAVRSLCADAPRVAAQIFRNLIADVARRLRDAGERLTDAAAASPKATSDSPRASLRGLTVAQLQQYPALRDRTLEDLELLAYIANVQAFSRGTTLMGEGSFGTSCFLIVSGAVEVFRRRLGRSGAGVLGSARARRRPAIDPALITTSISAASGRCSRSSSASDR